MPEKKNKSNKTAIKAVDKKTKQKTTVNQAFEEFREELHNLKAKDIASILLKASNDHVQGFKVSHLNKAISAIIKPRLIEQGIELDFENAEMKKKITKALSDFFRPRFQALINDKILGKNGNLLILKKKLEVDQLKIDIYKSLGPRGRQKLSEDPTNPKVKKDLNRLLDALHTKTYNNYPYILETIKESEKHGIIFGKKIHKMFIQKAVESLKDKNFNMDATKYISADRAKLVWDRIDKKLIMPQFKYIKSKGGGAYEISGDLEELINTKKTMNDFPNIRMHLESEDESHYESSSDLEIEYPLETANDSDSIDIDLELTQAKELSEVERAIRMKQNVFFSEDEYSDNSAETALDNPVEKQTDDWCSDLTDSRSYQVSSDEEYIPEEKDVSEDEKNSSLRSCSLFRSPKRRKVDAVNNTLQNTGDAVLDAHDIEIASILSALKS